MVLRCYRGVLVASAAMVLLTGCGSSPSTTPAPQTTAPVDTRAEYQLAVIDSKTTTPSPEMISSFDSVLSSLEAKCTQTRSSAPSLGDIGVTGARLLREAQRPMSVLDVLRAIEASIPADVGLKLDCAEVGALLLTQMGV